MFDFVRLLSPAAPAIDRDNRTFNEWEQGLISTYGAIAKFKTNNRIMSEYFIEPREFEMWMRSLGYIR